MLTNLQIAVINLKALAANSSYVSPDVLKETLTQTISLIEDAASVYEEDVPKWRTEELDEVTRLNELGEEGI